MDQLKEKLAVELIKTGSRDLAPRQFDVVIALFMLFGSGAAFDEASVGIDEQRYRLDSRLFTRLYDSCPDPLKLALFGTFAPAWLEPRVFAQLIRHAWSISSATTLQREAIAARLEGFLVRHPERADEHRDIILELLRSPRRELCTRGLLLVSSLNDIEPADLAYLRRRLSAAAPEPRMNALNGLCAWLKRHRELSPRVLAFCTSPQVKKEAGRLLRSDRNKDVRTCAHFMLKALRTVIGSKAAAVRTPRREMQATINDVPERGE